MFAISHVLQRRPPAIPPTSARRRERQFRGVDIHLKRLRFTTSAGLGQALDGDPAKFMSRNFAGVRLPGDLLGQNTGSATPDLSVAVQTYSSTADGKSDDEFDR